jgi:hypothetical protein
LRARAGWAICALLLGASWASAHIVYDGTTLRQHTLESDLVVRARIVDPAAELWLEEPLLREAVVVAEVLEVLKGASEAGAELRFVQHGHGVPLYAKGEEVLLFLRRIESSRELGASGIATRIRFVSVQEGERFALGAGTRDAFTAAVGVHAEIERLPAASRLDALRRITLSLLASPEPRVRTAAIRGLGKIGTRGAREALAKAAASHPDAATRRRAGAQVKLLERDAAPSRGTAP